MCEGEGNCLKYLKWGWNRKEGGGTKILKRGKAGPRGGCLKKGGWNSLTNYGPSLRNLIGVLKHQIHVVQKGQEVSDFFLEFGVTLI